ncbi:MFS transporter [Acidisoma cellulosilytica]|uniref:MFS transporter n=1 Tax=Acidisoma cellulosilyticum TaxID=2802395 RepID=A0A964E4P3_9PROT|nr:MDR family MFS transporter [Acidisoma cellulosilyticum]MCB8881178.1 MFS transporter [Acidisoma cellulosilyticum]
MTSIKESTQPSYNHAQILRVITGIMLCMLLAALDQTVVIPAVPAIAHDLRSYDHLAWIVTAYLLTSTAATPIFGKLSDIHGRRAVMNPAIAMFMIASALCALAQNLPELIIARGLQGIGGAGLFAMAQASIADVVSPRERGRYQGYLAGTWAVASIAGPVIGGYVTEGLSWRWIFWMNLPLGLLAIFLCDRALRLLVVVPRPSRIDIPGALLMTGAVTALLLMLSWGGTAYPWLSLPVVLVGLLGLLMLGGLVMQERRAPDPLLPPRLFTNDIFLRGVSVAFFGSLGLFVATFLLPINFQLVHGYGPETAGLLVMPFLVFSTVGAYLAGLLARRLGKSKIILLGGLGSAILGFLLLTLNTVETSAVVIMVESVILGTGIGMCMPTSIVVVQNAVEQRDIGTATGSLLLLRSIGGAFGSTVAGSLLTLRFRQSEHAAHLRHAIDFGALSQGTHALDGLSAQAHDAIRHGLSSGFTLAYLVTAVLLSIAILFVFGLRDIALRSSAKPEGSTIGH